jgi:RNA polymerase sigma-70 factor (ECF subfamily)
MAADSLSAQYAQSDEELPQAGRRQGGLVAGRLLWPDAVSLILLKRMEDQAPKTPPITQLLIAWSDGRREALDDLMPIVYADLRRLAGGYMRRESADHALQPTALVHEAYVRLIDQKQVKWRNRAHFFGVAAGMMRRILVDNARRRRAEKRGGDWERVTLADVEAAADGQPEIDVLALNDALERLAEFDPQQERIVELRYFGGLTIEETAEVVGISPATVVREWTIAKAWLRADLSRSG